MTRRRQNAIKFETIELIDEWRDAIPTERCHSAPSLSYDSRALGTFSDCGKLNFFARLIFYERSFAFSLLEL